MVARRALRLGDRTVREIMRPRIEIDALDVDTPPEEVIGAVAMAGFSRLPVHEGDLDHIIGFVYTKDLLLRQHMGWPIELRKLVRPALLVPETLRIDKLLERFRAEAHADGHRAGRVRRHRGPGDHGGRAGGAGGRDPRRAPADRQQEIVQHGAGPLGSSTPAWACTTCWSGLGLEARESDLPPDVSTAGGLVLWLLGRIPKVGDHAAWKGLRLEVVAMDGRRLDRLAVRVAKDEGSATKDER